ncbi:MAG: type II toxin-antitoxin system RelE/ParE family toxin [Nitrospirae bacterium]|nr:type II toxin-antitoxin system RelE/ParE family toxin [Nitrospirota bacterium]
MAKIKWSKDSIDDLKEICKFIAEDSPYYANIIKDRIFEMVEHLESSPEMGRMSWQTRGTEFEYYYVE